MRNVFTIIVTFNGVKWIESCIDSLLKSAYPTIIVVIDNASTDNTLEILSKYGDQLLVIKNRENEGFGSANNRGIQYALERKADMFFLLNQDVYLYENTIGLLVKALQENPDYGIMSPLQLEPGGLSLDANLKTYIKRNYSEEFVQNLLKLPGPKDLSKPFPMRFVNAAAWMISRECLERTGLFHAAFFHYGEDNNYSARVQYHGLKSGLLPQALVIHDREINKSDKQKLLIRQLRTVPLHTLLDIRKPFIIAWLLGKRKLHRISGKLSGRKTEELENLIKEQAAWFSSKKSLARKIRQETRARFMPGQSE